MSLRHDITEEHAAREVLEKEVTSLLVQLHRVQLQLHSNSEATDSESIREKLVSHSWNYLMTILDYNYIYYCRKVSYKNTRKIQ